MRGNEKSCGRHSQIEFGTRKTGQINSSLISN